ncbi:MAG: phage portal protein [Burkholderiales bacterium]|jgi:lambda family phage portal protein|nr:phage portal protein [Burkholderiales bacterium]
MNQFPTLARRGFILPTRLRASYEGAGTGRRAASWKTSASGPNATLLPNLQRLRDRSRAAFRNDAYGFSVIDKMVSNHIGTGITPRPQISDKTLRIAMQDLWTDWTDEADFDGVTDFYGLQALAANCFFMAGECFGRFVQHRITDDYSVPLQVQLLAPEFVPLNKNEKLTNGNEIKAGIEFDRSGKRVAYHVCKRHPKESGGSEMDTVRVDASEMVHVFEPFEPGQIRGAPILTPVLLRLKTLDDLDDAVVYRQEVANLFAGFIRKTGGEPSVSASTGQPDNLLSGGTDISIEPGTMQELLPGEDVTFSDPPDAGSNYAALMKQQLQAVAAGVGIPYELLTGDTDGISDRVLRIIVNEFRRRVEMRQFGIFVHQFCRPVRNRWIDVAFFSGALDLPDYATQRRVCRRTRWVPQGWAYMHPVQDVTSKQLEVRSGFISRSETVLQRGYDSEVIDEENRSDNERADQLGLRYDSDGRKSRLSPASDSTIASEEIPEDKEFPS